LAFIVLASFVAAGLFWFVLSKLDRPEPERCERKLVRIGSVLMLYQMENKGVLPQNLEVLVARGYLRQSDLICSRSHGTMKFRYFVGGKKFTDIAPSEIMAADPPAAHQKGGNVLFGDGGTSWLDGFDFQKVSVPATQP
jgi:prepilin-type processing-associated H-X9-DG protein